MSYKKMADRVLDQYMTRNSDRLLHDLHTNEKGEVFLHQKDMLVNKGGDVILFPEMAKDNIFKYHGKAGLGSVFHPDILKDLHRFACNLDLTDTDKIYTYKCEFSGYDLVHDYENFMKNFSDDILGESYVEKWDCCKDKPTIVKLFVVSSDPSCFKTDIISYKILDTSSILSNQDRYHIISSNNFRNETVEEAIENHKLFAIVDATPGRYIANDQWKSKVIVVPNYLA